MPAKTIYIAKEDLPLLRQAQSTTGKALSPTIIDALRRLVATPSAPTATSFDEVRLQLARNEVLHEVRFKGRRIAEWQGVNEQGELVSAIIYLTPKNAIAVFVMHHDQPNSWRHSSWRADTHAAPWKPRQHQLHVIAPHGPLPPLPKDLARLLRDVESGNRPQINHLDI